jgi:CTP synthase
MKYIVITGGVISGLGKGITASSIGLLLKQQGLCVTAIKIDPYLNVDAGTMSPFEHGECYVLGDGAEVDLDMGNYERFLGTEFTGCHNITTGKIYSNVINKERKGAYLGKTVQTVPHVTDEIKERILTVSHNLIDNKVPDVCIIEMGGTVGDIELMHFIETIRQMHNDKKHQFCFIHVSLIINCGEYKTKPTQHSLEKLRQHGIFPNFLVIRTGTETFMDESFINKLSILSGIPIDNIIQNINVKNIYFVPEIYKQQNLIQQINTVLGLSNDNNIVRDDSYTKIINYFNTQNHLEINIAVAGKYTGTPDTYLSIIRSIEHAAINNNVIVNIHWINTKTLNSIDDLGNYDGFIIPGGFGATGIDGKLLVAKYCKNNKIPLLGICLGFQIMVIEAYCSVTGKEGSSTEFDPDTPNKIIDILPNQTGLLGGTMRLGNYLTNLDPQSIVSQLYACNEIIERHRHRYEVNNDYINEIEKSGLKFVGYSKAGNDKQLAEIVELKDHPFYIGCQFHPEFKTRYDKPHPLFNGLIGCIKKISLTNI